MHDIELITYEYLNSSSTFKTDIGSNLFIDRVENFDGSSSKGCRFRIKGGSLDVNNNVESGLIDFFCYGGSSTLDDSRQVYIKLLDRLHGITNEDTTNGNIISARLATTGQNLIEPDTNWYYIFCTFEVVVRSKT